MILQMMFTFGEDEADRTQETVSESCVGGASDGAAKEEVLFTFRSSIIEYTITWDLESPMQKTIAGWHPIS